MALGIFTCRRSLQCIAPNKRCRARQREKRVNEINAKTKAWGEKAALLARSLAPSTDQPLNTQDSSRTRCALGVLKFVFEVLRDLLVGLPRVVVLNVGVGIGASPLYSCTTYSHILLPVRSTSCESAWLPMSRRTEYSRSPYFESHLGRAREGGPIARRDDIWRDRGASAASKSRARPALGERPQASLALL